MRVLFLSPQLPYPARSGAAIRNLGLIKGLALRHEVTLLTFAEPDGLHGAAVERRSSGDRSAGACPPPLAGPSPDRPPEATDVLRTLCRSVEVVPRPTRTGLRRLAEMPGPDPDLVRRLASPELAARARSLLAAQPFDVVHVGGLELAPVGLALRGHAAVVLDEHNAEYVLQRRAFENECRLGGNPVGAAYSLLQWRKLQRYEGRACRLADGVMAVSEVDRRALLDLAPQASVTVVPNSIDVADYQPDGRHPASPPTLLFAGKMDFRPNVDAVVWFAREVLPLIRERVPGARFQVVGRDPTPTVLQLAGLPGVEVVGPVPDDRPYVASASACVVPMRVGGGTRIKILQAMAAGLPVVSTTLGCEGVAATPGEHLLVADEPAAFAGAIAGLLARSELADRLARRGRALVEARYDWRVLAPMVEEVYRKAVSGLAGAD